MGELEELAEKIEDAAHEGEDAAESAEAKSPIGTYVGLTMAVLGVLLAVCSAMVGGARTELIGTMVEQTATSNLHRATAMKYRTLMAQLQQLHALLPSDPRADAAADDAIARVAEGAPAESAPVLRTLHIEALKVLDTVIPTRADVLRLVAVARDYERERQVVAAWMGSYEDEIRAWSVASEHYEWGQLCAELGIVFSSIALLLRSRAAWGAALLLALGSGSLLVWTYADSHEQLARSGHGVEEAKKAYAAVHAELQKGRGDEELLHDIQRTFAPAGARP
jgi:hypothetical protein